MANLFDADEQTLALGDVMLNAEGSLAKHGKNGLGALVEAFSDPDVNNYDYLKRGLIHPHSGFRRLWDFATMYFVMYTAIVLPGMMQVLFAPSRTADPSPVACMQHAPTAGPPLAAACVSRVWRTGDMLESEGYKSFRSTFGPSAFTLQHRFYLHLDRGSQLWLSAEDGCEGVAAAQARARKPAWLPF